MNNFEINTSSRGKAVLTSVSCDTVITHDVSEEFTLPDYVPEVRRVLFTRAQILPESKYISDTQGGAKLDFGGTVTYSVIYTDDEGRLCSTPLSSNYEASAVLKCQPSLTFVDTLADNVTTRVNAPRKLTVKSRLKSRIFGTQGQEISENINQKSSADELYIERLTQSVSTLSVASSTLQNIKMSEKFDTGSKKSLRPILCDAVAYLKDVKATNGGVSCHGDVIVKCLCESEGELISLSKTLPIYEEIALEGALISDMARATARCVSLSISSEENDDNCELFFDIICEIDAEVYRNVESMLTSDCYSTKNDMEASYREIELFSVAKSSNSSFSFNESTKRKSKDADEIVDALLDAVCEKCEIKGERALISGRLCANIIARSARGDNGEVEYLHEEYELPFKYDCEIGRKCENPISRISITASLISAKYSDDKLHLSAELFPSVCVLDKSSATVLDSATLKKDKEFKNDSSCVRVYFPKDCDILWEVAKKYHTTRAKIIEQNSLSSESLEGVKNIII